VVFKGNLSTYKANIKNLELAIPNVNLLSKKEKIKVSVTQHYVNREGRYDVRPYLTWRIYPWSLFCALLGRRTGIEKQDPNGDGEKERGSGEKH
jgi:hypothetical protein